MSDKMYEKVIEAGKFSEFEYMWSDYHWLFYLSIVLAVLVVVGSVYSIVVGAPENLILLLPFGLLIFGANVGYMSVVYSDKLASDVENWKKTHVSDLFEQLPVEKSEVVYIKIDPEISNEFRGERYWISPDTKKLTPLVVSFKSEDGIETVTDWFSTKMVLTDEERPYIEYKRLVKDLGNDVNAGVYDAVVYLPEDYTFTDIK